MPKTLGFALGAGGARGVAHVGFLKAMEEAGIVPDFLAGSSMGSVIGACYAAGMTADEMREALKSLRAGDVVDLGVRPIRRLGLLKWERARKFLEAHIAARTFEELRIPFCCVAVDIKSGKEATFSSGDLLSAVLASGTIPAVFRPVEREGGLYVDGGVLCRVPVRQVKAMGADVVVAVDVLGRCRETEKVPHILSLGARVYDIMDDARTQAERRRTRRITDLWLEPDMGDLSQYKVRYYDEAYEAGYRIGTENAERIRTLIVE